MRDAIAKGFLRFANRNRDGNSKAALAGAAKGAVADDLRGEFHVRIGQNDDVILRTALALHAFAACGGTRVDVLCNRSGADKTNGAHLRMVAECVDDFFPAVDEIHHSFGQAGLLQELESAMHGERNTLGRLQDETVSARDGVRKEPVGNHRRKVEGHNGGDDAERLANLHFIDAGSHVLKVVALHHHGNAASDFNVFDGAAELGAGFGEGFAVFECDDAGEIVKIFFEEIFQLEEILDALTGRRAPPRRERIGSGLNGSVDVGGSRKGRAREEFRGRRIGDIKVFGCSRSAPGTIDVVLKIGDLGGYGTAHTQLLGLGVGYWKRSVGPTR